MSGTPGPHTSYKLETGATGDDPALTGADAPTKYEAEKDEEEASDPNKPKKPSSKPFNNNGPAYIRSQAPITSERGRQMGYRDRIALWRIASMNAKNCMEFLVPAVQKKLSELKSFKGLGLSLDDLVTARDIYKQALVSKTSPDAAEAQLAHAFKADPTKIESLNNFLRAPLKSQFGRGLPAHIFEIPRSISALSDVSLEQRIDPHNDFVLQEKLNTLEQAIFYASLELKTTPTGGFEMIRTDPITNEQSRLFSSVITEGKKPGQDHEISFELEDNSREAVIALADMISMHRQGNSNHIELTTLGDPVAFLVLVEQLVCVHNMHAIIPGDLKLKALEELSKLDPNEYPQKNAILDRAKFIFKNADAFSYSSHKSLSSWTPNPYAIGNKRTELLAAVNGSSIYESVAPAPAPKRAAGPI